MSDSERQELGNRQFEGHSLEGFVSHEEEDMKTAGNLDGESGESTHDEPEDNALDVSSFIEQTTPQETAGEEGEDSGQLPETIEIKHNGQIHRLTRDKYTELAQKGFDYDQKMGPHRKLIELYQNDPVTHKTINDRLEDLRRQARGEPPVQPGQGPKQEEQKFVPKPLKDFDTEEEWMQHNLEAFGSMVRQQTLQEAQAVQMQQPQRDQGMNPTVQLVAAIDHQDYAKVLPYIPKLVMENLPPARIQQIETDPGAFAEFYWQAKRALAQNNLIEPKGPLYPSGQGAMQQEPSGHASSSKKAEVPFRSRSKGGEGPKAKPPKDAFDLPNAEWERIKAKAKGFG